MRLRNRKSPLLLLFLPSLAVAAAVADKQLDRDSAAISEGASSARRVGTKDAPVDGKDGKPHAGPFVELDTSSESARDLPALKDRPADPLVVDGKRIPESHDGVMDDKNRPGPKKGTTGTEGGVSEKSKDRELREKQTGEKVENKPPTPKEPPPLPHSDQERIQADSEASHGDKAASDISGLEKPADLPDKTHDKSLPLPESVANIDHLDVSKGGQPVKSAGVADEDNEGLIRPFHSFVLSLTMIVFSEIGDKTFLVAALMAMKHDRLVVFTAAFSALITMTLLSAVLGHAVPTLIPKRVTTFLAAVLFLVFGARLLREGLAMSPDEGVSAEMQEVEQELEEKENLARKEGRMGSHVSPYALEMGLGNRKPRSKSRFPTPARSPSSSPEGRSPSPRPGALVGFLSGLNNLLSLLLSPAWVQTFVMTFLGEWGDRSQIATIAMAAGQDYWWVTLGAVLGHGCCTGVAVIGGRAIAGKVSLKVVTVGGAIAFLFFGFIYLFEAFYS
ncbi:hypothetical protein C8A03DRAFT_29778 [Achaetomium macrosporum]|uniref:Uncharacterized protein n=1 Tax=Achaetomium macrosporum TaxID=79813 RepID=A0AAN7CHS2_9PEZI|nr:hypothetical protein C8A03DRAFT_29778 [Achaetomium macrosporum]